MPRLDANQVIKEVYDISTGALKTTSAGGSSTVEIAGSLVPEAHDYIALTYVPSGNGAGEIQTATYKTGGAGGTTVATLTLTYNVSNQIDTITRS